MKSRIVLLLCAFALTAGMLRPAVNSLDQKTLKSYLEEGAPFDFILVDVRGEDELDKAIGSLRCKPYNLPWPDQLKSIPERVPKDTAIIVYCRSGGRAERAAAFLEAAGFTRVYNAGGILSWTGPTVSASEIKPAKLLPEPSCGAAPAAGKP